MDIIEKAKELGKLLQEDERYLKFKAAEEAGEKDKELQDLIGEFNLKKLNINNETMKQDKDLDKIKELDKELNDIYKKILANENMENYNKSGEELNKLVNYICTIISQSSEGQDPETISESNGCGGNCASCTGCH